MDLQYPPSRERPVGAAAKQLSFRPGQAPPRAQRAFNLASLWPPGSDGDRPSFAGMLQRSLKREAELRAWFDAKLSYQHVQQTRLPKALPKVGSAFCPTCAHCQGAVVGSGSQVQPG